MYKEILDYIQTQRICVLAVEMPDGSPHAATVHFAYSESPFEFYIFTDTDTRKYESLLAKVETRASVVVGFDDTKAVMKTLQIDGKLSVLKDEKLKSAQEIYFGKYENKKEFMDDEECSLMVFIPTWWRFTDWTTPEGKKIWLSTDK